MTFLVVGAAGFIGFHICKRLLTCGNQVVGIDNLNNYYDVKLKRARIELITFYTGFQFIQVDIANDQKRIISLFQKYRFERVIHLAAQPGVRYSIENPYVYADVNLIGYLNILECCRQYKIEHLLYASSSSVYGLHSEIPFLVNDNTEHPISFYAATKKSNELMSHVYSYLYSLPTTGLRFFSVYGPWGRPDMAIFKFSSSMVLGKEIDVYNFGKMKRDFTYIDDVVEAVIRLQALIPEKNEKLSLEEISLGNISKTYRIYNIGTGQSVMLIRCIEILEKEFGIIAKKNMLPKPLPDLLETVADVSDLVKAIDFKPQINIEKGIGFFVNWFRSYYRI